MERHLTKIYWVKRDPEKSFGQNAHIRLRAILKIFQNLVHTLLPPPQVPENEN